jgi:hypothetical protein
MNTGKDGTNNLLENVVPGLQGLKPLKKSRPLCRGLKARPTKLTVVVRMLLLSSASENLLQHHLVEAVAELFGQIQRSFIRASEGMDGVEPSRQPA